MESTQPDFNDKYMNLIHPDDMVNPQQTPIFSIWRAPSGHDLYKKFIFIRPPFDPLNSVGAEARPSDQTIDRPIKQVVNPTATSLKVQSNTGVIFPSNIQGNLTVTPTTPPIQPTTPYIPSNPVRTPLHHKTQNPTINVHSTTIKILTRGKPSYSRPVPPRGKSTLPIRTGGKPPFIG
jgi:hypothetical protein